MQRHSKPATDPRITSGLGLSRDGQPIAYNRAPAADLSPWVARLYASKLQLPSDCTLSCSLFGDTPFIRLLLEGEWTAVTADGPKVSGAAAVFCGPNSKRLPVSVKGGFTSVGIAMRPGACTALKGPSVGDYVDRVVPLETVALPSDVDFPLLDPDAPPETWLLTLEDLVRRRVEATGFPLPDPLAARFEEIAFRDPSITVAEAAQECGVDRRKLERIVKRDFGMPPKQVLRRSRALDMASHLRGVADQSEADELALRYYDESHLIHEFIELFGMSPRQFADTPQPLLTMALEARQARRLETLNRIRPGDPPGPSWADPKFGTPSP